MEKGRLPQKKWEEIQQAVPIACVDVLMMRTAPTGDLECGLILRDTPHQGRRWCLIGGRFLRNETFVDGIDREVRAALGSRITCVPNSPVQPLYVAEYFSVRRRSRLFDPRQHAIGLVFGAQIQGEPYPCGEALEFQWFRASRLPDAKHFGFGQQKVVAECLAKAFP